MSNRIAHSLPLLAAGLALLGGCAGYEPPRPGQHRAPGDASAPDVVCSYETQTATRFSSMRCLRAEDMAAQSETARRETDAIKTPPPPPGSLR